MADGKIKGKQIEDTTVSLNKLSGDGQLILGSASQIQITGTSIGDDDIVTRKELSSVGNLKITDYNTGSSFSNIQNIIFRGQSVLVPNPPGATADGVLAVNGGAPNSVLVWIPAPTYVDYFNQGDATVAPEATTTRFVANQGSTFSTGDWGDFATVGRPVFNQPGADVITYASTEFSVVDLSANNYVGFSLIDADDSTVLLTGTQALSAGTGSYNFGGAVDVNITQLAVDQDRYKASVNFTTTTSLLGGVGERISVELFHINSFDGTYTFEQRNVLLDPDDNSPFDISMDTPTVAEKTPVLVWRSGIAYYSDNSSFTFSVTNIDNLNNHSYPRGTSTTAWGNASTSNQLRVTPLNFNANVSYGHSQDFIGWDDGLVDNVEWTFEETINAASAFIPDLDSSNDLDATVNTLIRVNAFDWIQGPNEDSANFDALIDTFAYSNSNLVDPVGDESKRLSFSDLTFNSGSWDSTAALGDDYLQVAFDKMFYPREDYSSYNPNINITNARDYSALGSGSTQSFEVYTQVSVNNATTTVNLGGYKWYVSHFLLGAVSNTGTFTFTSNIVESDFEIELGNNAVSGDDDIAILVGHDSGSAGAGTVPDRWVYATGDYSGRTATTNNFDGSPKEISYTWGTVGNYSRVWIAVGINTNKQNRYISEISLAAGT